jgi:hypothetical protein
MFRVSLLPLAALLSFVFLFSQTTFALEKRVALVIGNSAYKDSPLINPANDARDMASKLTSLGFSVDKLLNANYRQMTKAIQDFGKKLRGENTVGLFYFAGHGVQVNGSNFLLPVSYNIETEADIEFEAVNAARVLSQMESAENNLNLMILDACRNNPFARSFRSSTRGLAKMQAPSGSMILYATSPGDVAADGSGRNGLFTEKLMSMMDKKGLKIYDVFHQTANAVSNASGRQQIPYIEGVILGDFYFNAPVSIMPAAKHTQKNAQSDMASRIELEFWNSVQADPGKEMYQAYIDEYPNGRYVKLAKIKLKHLTRESRQQPSMNTKQKIKPPTSQDKFFNEFYGNNVGRKSTEQAPKNNQKTAPPFSASHSRNRANLGVKIQSLTADIAKALGIAKQGVLVAEVLKDSSAFKAGIKAGDVILQADYKKISQPAELVNIISAKNVSDKVVLLILRDKNRFFVAATLSSRLQ